MTRASWSAREVVCPAGTVTPGSEGAPVARARSRAAVATRASSVDEATTSYAAARIWSAVTMGSPPGTLLASRTARQEPPKRSSHSCGPAWGSSSGATKRRLPSDPS